MTCTRDTSRLCQWQTRRKEQLWHSWLRVRKGDGCAQHSSAKDIDGRVDLPTVDGVAPRNRIVEFVDIFAKADNETALTS